MPLEAKPERAMAEKLILDNKLSFEQIAKDTKYSIQHIRRIAKKLKDKGIPLPPVIEGTGTGEVQKIIAEVPITTEEPERLTVLQEEQLKGQAQVEKVASLLDQGDIQGIFQAVNTWLPSERKKTPEQLELLGKTWEKPFSDFFPTGNEDTAKYAGLVLASTVTLIIFAPELKDYVVPFATRKKPASKEFVEDTEEQKQRAEELANGKV